MGVKFLTAPPACCLLRAGVRAVRFTEHRARCTTRARCARAPSTRRPICLARRPGHKNADATRSRHQPRADSESSAARAPTGRHARRRQRRRLRAATVANVIARAGVSRRTFYAYFTDKDDCFLALYRDISKRLLDQIARAVNDSPPEQALQAVVRQLTEHAETQPAQAQFLASDALAGGPPALHERERTISQISDSVERAHAIALAPDSRSPDLPAQAVVGATHSLISQRVRQGERNLAQLTQELTHWLKYYERPIGKHRWSTLSPGPRPESSLHVPELSR